MIDGSSNLHKVITPALEKETLEAFLDFLGISYIDGRVISTRNVEVYKDSTNDVGDYYVNIFDGFFHIRFNVFYNVFDGDFTVQLHKTIDALKKAKNRPIDDKHKRTRMKVYSE
ncbi:hypothetical protein PRIPAC_79834 [Pristionchus pacificus]|uniref:Uncharacterized protein n=1 Tax=Pristionchus pacificus TaxID=54126 RepID=A0A2A6BVC4_PRIPA|nr:hypothetical protein PRIPAC_79834 [Pristionchus pacificus]|eukprot:PDM69952.1 hypothetical protein PRIPAC_49164 [Pristionchus pacificus]